MTEYVLVLKQVADSWLKGKIMKENSDAVTPLHSEPPTITRYRESQSPPNLDHVIDLIVEEKNKGYAKSLVKLFQDNPDVRIDVHGNITSPNIGLNIGDVIQYFITNKAGPFTKEKIRVLNSFVKVPEYYIRHKGVRNFLYEKQVPHNNRNGGTDLPSTLSQSNLSASFTTPPSTPVLPSRLNDAVDGDDRPLPPKRLKRNRVSHWQHY